MKLKLSFFIVFLSFFLGHGAQALDSFTSGEDWAQKMSRGEKFISVLRPALLLHRYGVPLRHRPEEYVSALDKVIYYNPQLEKEDIANIFASTVYRLEPQTRRTLEIMEMEFLRGNMDAIVEFSPRLAIHVPREAEEIFDEE